MNAKIILMAALLTTSAVLTAFGGSQQHTAKTPETERRLTGDFLAIAVDSGADSVHSTDSTLQELTTRYAPAVQDAGSILLVKEKSQSITLEQAKQIVFDYLGITEAQVSQLETEKDGKKYEIDFVYENTEYEFDVEITTGRIMDIQQEEKKPATQPKPEPKPESITLEQAKQIVFDYLGITEAQVSRLETEKDGKKYEIDFVYENTEYEFDVEITTGKILDIQREEKKPATQPKPEPKPESITLEQAKQIVFDYLGITEAQVSRLETEKDGKKYEIDFVYENTEYEFDVEITTGKILKADQEPADFDDD